jgi:hypothetical protein
MGLWVEVNQPYSIPGFGEGCTQVHGRRRFANAAFLIDDCNTAHRGNSISLRLLIRV